MANRFFDQFRFSLEKNVVELWADITLNGASNPTVNRAKGITSVTRSGAGQLTFTFQDRYNRLVDLAIDGIKGVTIANVPVIVGPVLVTTDNTGAAAKTLVVSLLTMSIAAAGTLSFGADPGGTPEVFMRFTFSNSSAL